jgi:hypothetical protein
MSASFLALKRAMGTAGATGLEPSWAEVMGELWPVISLPLSVDGERLLLEVIHHRGQLHLTETSDLPHSMAPDEMLKSLAVQALARWTGLTYLTELQRLELTASSSSLQSTVRAVIQTAQANRPLVTEGDVIFEEELNVDEGEADMVWSVLPYQLSSQRSKPTVHSRRSVTRPVERFGNLTLINSERPRRSRRKEDYELVR